MKWKLPFLICRNQPDTVVSALDLDKVKQDMFYSLAIPVPCILLSVLYFVIAKYAEKIKKPRGVRGEQRMQSLSIFCVFYLSRNELLFLQPYRPVASIAMGSALTAMLDIQVMECSQKITLTPFHLVTPKLLISLIFID